jgi:hypothetical protein
MEKFITRDDLLSFVEAMWDAGLRMDLKPTSNQITVWSDDISKLTYVSVMSSQTFNDVVSQVFEEVRTNTEEA